VIHQDRPRSQTWTLLHRRFLPLRSTHHQICCSIQNLRRSLQACPACRASLMKMFITTSYRSVGTHARMPCPPPKYAARPPIILKHTSHSLSLSSTVKSNLLLCYSVCAHFTSCRSWSVRLYSVAFIFVYIFSFVVVRV